MFIKGNCQEQPFSPSVHAPVDILEGETTSLPALATLTTEEAGSEHNNSISKKFTENNVMEADGIQQAFPETLKLMEKTLASPGVELVFPHSSQHVTELVSDSEVVQVDNFVDELVVDQTLEHNDLTQPDPASVER